MSFVSSLLAGCVFKCGACLQRDQTETDTSSQILLLRHIVTIRDQNKTYHETWFKFVWNINGPDVPKRLRDSRQVDFVCLHLIGWYVPRVINSTLKNSYTHCIRCIFLHSFMRISTFSFSFQKESTLLNHPIRKSN